jgi:hypothetical protein
VEQNFGAHRSRLDARSGHRGCFYPGRMGGTEIRSPRPAMRSPFTSCASYGADMLGGRMGRQGGPTCHRYQAIVCEGGGWYAGLADSVAPTRRKARRCGGELGRRMTLLAHQVSFHFSFFYFLFLLFYLQIQTKSNLVFKIQISSKCTTQKTTWMQVCLWLFIYLPLYIFKWMLQIIYQDKFTFYLF